MLWLDPLILQSMSKVLRPETINPKLVKAEYAVRGVIPAMASVIAKVQD